MCLRRDFFFFFLSACCIHSLLQRWAKFWIFCFIPLDIYIYIEISLIFIWSAYSGVGNNFEILSVNVQIVHSVSKEKLPQQKKIYSEVKVWIKYNNWYMVLWAEICGERKKINWNSMSDKIFSRSILNGRKYIRTHFPPRFV